MNNRTVAINSDLKRLVGVIAFLLLVMDVMFLIWGIFRLILIAFPILQLRITEVLFGILGGTNINQVDPIFEGFRRMFILPEINRYNIFADVLLNGFITAVIFVFVVVIYIALRLIQRRIV